MARGINITTKEKKLLESYENGKCPECNSEIIGHPVKCPDYGYVLECGEDRACKWCSVEDTEPNPDIYWCEDCASGYNFKERCKVSRDSMNPKGSQSTFDEHFDNKSQ